MKTSDLFQETYWALTANKVRSFLTMLGIIIGIGSVIAMISIGQGVQSSIQSSIQSAGSNLLYVLPGAQRGPGVQVSSGRGSAQTLTQEDADAIEKSVTQVKNVAPVLSRRYQIIAKGSNTNTSVIGTVPAYADVLTLQTEAGSFITEPNLRSAAKVAVLGPTTRDDLFGQGSNPVGQTIKINKVEFRVVGVTQSKGGSGFNNPDDTIYVPITAAQRYLSGDKYVSTITVQAVDQQSMSYVQQQVTDILMKQHNIKDQQSVDFSIMNQADIVATASTVTNTFTLLLASIAGISLVVGGIGIMNMMLTTVTERTREIGLRKAIGAKRNDITLQFLVEAVALTFLGGFLGIVLGWIVSYLITAVAGITTQVSMFSVLLSFGVSAAIGVMFGYYPARRAANLNPIDALRFE